MTDVSIVGVGQTPVGEHWNQSLRMLAAEAALAALHDAGLKRVDALYVGNGYGGTVNSQTQLGALVADYIGMPGTEAYTVEAAEASGGAALRTGYIAVKSGVVDTALVVGVEKLSDKVADDRVVSLGVSLDADFEAVHGATLPAMAALLMRRYMHEYGATIPDFEGFSINAHANGTHNPNAMFRKPLREGIFAKAPMVAEPVSLFDGAPDADGAAAVILVNGAVADGIGLVASTAVTDTFKLQDRSDMLWLEAAARSTAQALRQSGLKRNEISLFELHDSFTILAALSLEAAGFAERGHGWEMAAESGQLISTTGNLPISTFGGLKSRGNPSGAVGIYQAVEAALQLRGAAGENQVKGARTALIQNLGGLASTAFSHILQTW